jgi:hypothetical protein
MKINEITFNVTLTKDEVIAICQAIEHIRLDKTAVEGNPNLIYNTSSVLNGFKDFCPEAKQALDYLAEAFEEETFNAFDN